MRVLLVEDNPDHAELVQTALEMVGASEVHIVGDVCSAKEFMEVGGVDLVLLDLKLPKVDGFSLLSWMRASPGRSRLPVVVLTTSVHPDDMRRAYSEGASGYVIKPARFEELVRAMDQVVRFWSVGGKVWRS